MSLHPEFNPTRLQICAYLSGCDQADFSAVQEYCHISASTLSKALSLLDELGHVQIEKTARGRYTATLLRLTDEGRMALADHLAELTKIAEQARQASR